MEVGTTSPRPWAGGATGYSHPSGNPLPLPWARPSLDWAVQSWRLARLGRDTETPAWFLEVVFSAVSLDP